MRMVPVGHRRLHNTPECTKSTTSSAGSERQAVLSRARCVQNQAWRPLIGMVPCAIPCGEEVGQNATLHSAKLQGMSQVINHLPAGSEMVNSCMLQQGHKNDPWWGSRLRTALHLLSCATPPSAPCWVAWPGSVTPQQRGSRASAASGAPPSPSRTRAAPPSRPPPPGRGR